MKRVLLVALWLALLFAGSILGCRRPALPVLGQLPPFALTNQNGITFGSADLRGKVWVADFVFVSCSEVCPRLTARMKKLGDRLSGVALVTVTVDPQNDTPARLKSYAESYHADLSRWAFLTGDAKVVEEIVVRGFKIAMGKEDQGGILTIFHGEHFVLVDGQGRIRGYYVSDDEGLAKLVSDVASLG